MRVFQKAYGKMESQIRVYFGAKNFSFCKRTLKWPMTPVKQEAPNRA